MFQLLVIILLHSALSSIGIGRDISFDEGFTILITQVKSFSFALEAIASDTTPPFFYSFVFLIQKWTQSVTDLRVFTLFLSVASITAMYIGTKKLWNHQLAIISSLLFAFTPVTLYNATNIRMYSLLSIWVIFAITSFVELVKKNKNEWCTCSYVFLLSITLSLFTHYYAYFLIPGFFLASFLAPTVQKKIIALIIIAIGINVPWLIFTATHVHAEIIAQNSLIKFLLVLPSVFFNSDQVAQLDRQFQLDFFAKSIIFLATIIPSVVISIGIKNLILKNKNELTIFVIIVTFILSLSVFSLFVFPVISLHGIAILSAPVILLVTASLATLNQKAQVVIIICLVSVNICAQVLTFRSNSYDAQQLVTQLKKSPEIPLVVGDINVYAAIAVYARQYRNNLYLLFPNPVLSNGASNVMGINYRERSIFLTQKKLIVINDERRWKTNEMNRFTEELQKDFDYTKQSIGTFTLWHFSKKDKNILESKIND